MDRPNTETLYDGGMRKRSFSDGRPTKDEASGLDTHIIDVADMLFVEHGFADTSMSMIASQAKVGKHTLYRRFEDKSAVYRAVFRRRLEALPLPKLVEGEEVGLDRLRSLATAVLAVMCNREFVILNRVVILAADKFPEFVAEMRALWDDTLLVHFVEAVKGAQRTGSCIEGDAEQIARTAIWAVLGTPYQKSMIEDHLMTPKEQRDHLESSWSIVASGLTPR